MKFEGGEAADRPAARAVTQLGEGAGWPEQAIKEHGPGLYKFGSWDCVRRRAENCLRRCDAQSRGLKSVISVEVGFAVCVRGQVQRLVIVVVMVSLILVHRHVRNLLAFRLDNKGRHPCQGLPEHENDKQK
jgi:hypothetical protein